MYKATVTRADTSQLETYTGSTAQTMKGRWSGHDYDIRHPEKSGTTLSNYIHTLTRKGIGYTLKWEILKKAPPWNPITNICRLCTLEKHHILFHPEDSSLNQRSEFFTVCKHKEKHLLVKTWTASFFFLNISQNLEALLLSSVQDKQENPKIYIYISLSFIIFFTLVFICSNYV